MLRPTLAGICPEGTFRCCPIRAEAALWTRSRFVYDSRMNLAWRQALACRAVVLMLGTLGVAADAALAQPPPMATDVRTTVTLATPAAPAFPDVITRDGRGQATVRATRLAQALRVDGDLSEDVYRVVPPVTDFLQALPKEGAPATERTEAWVMFDGDSVYVSARCWDSSPPSAWVVNEMRRDGLQLPQNDNFAVMFDTFYDRRNGFVFYTNPLGALADFIVTDEGGINRDWIPVWQVRTGRFDGGWTVEMEIPFKSLRYNAGLSQVWGLQLRRSIRHKNEWTYLTQVPASVGDQRGVSRISAAGSLVGLELPGASKNVEVKPYGISRMATDRLTQVSNDLAGDYGVDLKYGVTANLTADVTYNTDFAQVEVDEQQINLTRFSLLFPEKREFFLEGRGLFEFGRATTSNTELTPTLFYSRRVGLNRNRVVPINVGGRLTGKVGSYGIGMMSIEADHEALSATPGTNFTVARVKRDVLRRSSVGMLFANRSQAVSADGSNQTYGADAAFSFFQDLNLGGFAAKTRTPGMDGDDSSYHARADYAGDRYGARLEYLKVGANFNPEIGFVRRNDVKRTFSTMRFSPRPASIATVRKFTWEATLDHIQNGAGHLESRQQSGRFETEFENSDRVTLDVTRDYELLLQSFSIGKLRIPRGSYTFSDGQVIYNFGPQRRLSGAVSLQRGQFYNGTITAAQYSGGRLSLTRQLSLEPAVSLTRIDVPEGRYTTALMRTRVDHAFSPRMFASALVQYNSLDLTFSGNARFRWEYRPGSELFVVYTDERDTRVSGFPVLKNRAVVVKVNRLLRF